CPQCPVVPRLPHHRGEGIGLCPEPPQRPPESRLHDQQLPVDSRFVWWGVSDLLDQALPVESPLAIRSWNHSGSQSSRKARARAQLVPLRPRDVLSTSSRNSSVN